MQPIVQECCCRGLSSFSRTAQGRLPWPRALLALEFRHVKITDIFLAAKCQKKKSNRLPVEIEQKVYRLGRSTTGLLMREEPGDSGLYSLGLMVLYQVCLHYGNDNKN